SPPLRAAIVISLIRRVNIFPRLASRAAFLCLMVAHFEWPDIMNLSGQAQPQRPGRTYCADCNYMRIPDLRDFAQDCWLISACLRAVTSISIFIRGSESPAAIMVAAG